MRAFLTARWAPLTAVIATVAYAVTVIGFGLNYRPLHNDEGVTLSVASRPSARDVLDVAIDDRHGPPLHYLAVHASLVLRDDMLGLRLPSALFGILAIALAYGFGRELLGRSGGAVLAVLVATIPEVVHLAQFARGYTAMLAASFGSMWLLLLLVRTRRARYVAPYAVSALLLVAAHPFGLFALASEMVLLVVLGLAPLRRGWRSQRRNLIVLSLALGAGLLAMLLLWRVYSQLQPKYGVGQGGAVVDLGSSEFWRRIGDAWTGSSYVIVWLALAAAALAGLVMLAMRDRRAALILGVWLVQPIVLLSILTATSPDFAPERHLSFMIPAYVAALATFLVEVGRRAGRYGPWLAALLTLAAITPGVVALSRDVGNFTPDLRHASLYLGSQFGSDDVLLSTGGVPEPGVDARLYGAYAALDASGSDSLSRWRDVGQDTGCDLVARLGDQPTPAAAWVLLRSSDAVQLATGLEAKGFDHVAVFGPFVVARRPLQHRTTVAALSAGIRAYRVAAQLTPATTDFAHLPGHLAQQRVGVQRLTQLPQLPHQGAGLALREPIPAVPLAQPLRELRLEGPGSQVARAVEAAVHVLEEVRLGIGDADGARQELRVARGQGGKRCPRVQLQLVAQLGAVSP